MKNALKSILAAVFVAALVAACTPKTETTATQDTVKVEAVAVDTTQVAADSTAAPADSTVAK
jgi:hypothetical protein